MAESKVAIQAEIKLTLTAEEAAWLKESLQNAHMRESPHDEHMRQNVWNALPSLRELQELRSKEMGR